MTSIDQALGAFADAWKRGERPDVDEHLARVPDADRDELAAAIASWLEIAPVPDYDEAALLSIRKEPALVSALAAAEQAQAPWPTRVALARRRAGLRLGDVAARLADAFGFAGAERQKTEDYLQQLEAAELDERRVSRRLVEALANALGADRDALMPGPMSMPAPAASPGLFRSDPAIESDDGIMADLEILSRAAATPAPEPMDDVDRLFRGGPGA